jgi:hypothetical protein
MKLIKRFAISFLFLISLFILTGLLFPKISYESRIEVTKPVDKAFFTFLDAGRMGEWFTGFKKIEYLSGMPNTRGSKFKLTFDIKNEEIVAIQEVTDFKWNKVFAFTLEHKMIKVESRIEFTEKGVGTEIVSNNVVRGKGVFRRFLVPFMKSGMKKQSQEDFDRLKKVIESI